MDAVSKKILSTYETLAERYDALIDHKPHNAYYDRPSTLAMLPDIEGKAVLDAACGPGKYAEILLARGAQVTAFDFSPQMIERAKLRNPGRGHFFVHDLTQPLQMFPDASFDAVLCALALEYVADWTNPIREFHRVLKPQGALVVSIEHPFFCFNFHQSKRYFDVEHVRCVWKGFGIPVEVNSFRRSLGDSITPFTENGFFIDRLVEPKPTPEFEALDPRHFKELNEFPSFLGIRAIKR